MFSVSDLSEEQIETIKGWVAEGARMADVQKRLVDDLGFNVTYMDTRFLSLDLELEYQSEKDEEEVAPESEGDLVVGSDPADALPPTLQEVTATVDQVARPGAMVSGGVTFSDGMRGTWLIDEMGRPSIDPVEAGYQPTEADLISFQEKLRVLLDDHQ